MPSDRNILAMGTSTRVGKYMKTPKTTPARLPSSVLRAGDGLNPFGADEDADHADEKDADDQQRKYLPDEAPGLPQPLLTLPGFETPRQRDQQGEQRGDARSCAR